MNPEEVKRIRERFGMTQGQFAAFLGVHRVTVVQWESGARRPSIMASRFLQLVRRLDYASLPRWNY